MLRASLLSPFNSLRLNTSLILHIGGISLEFALTVTSRKRPATCSWIPTTLVQRDANFRYWSLRLRQHDFEHFAEISKKTIDHAGAEQVRLVDTASPQPTVAFAQHQNNIELRY